ncbi:alpha/beta hydrolase [Streptomyces sp. JJ36]|uniref:alpha/beta hydrolase n=1 Tax=Streptomyces sp. JJ36 TaxID=2736645 RepID=UPI001F399A3C|nr:alpha/beta hydrolase [Streptomyces sp. JJ36]MCF6521768.1 hypothetical protein [Streptomyces sp. JJ36]
MVHFATLRDLKVSEFEEAADGYHKVSSAAGASKDRLERQIVAKVFPVDGGPDGAKGLSGEGASAARDRLTRLAKNFHYTQVECGLISAALNGLASDLRAAQKKLTAAVDEARSAGFTVGEDGSVRWVSDRTPTPINPEQSVTAQDSLVPLADPDPKRVKAQGYADRIGEALGDAAEADQKWGPKLRRLMAQNDLNVSAKDWADVHGDQGALQKVAGDYLAREDIPQGKSPGDNAKWWNSLTADEKADYVALYPASVGALDGLPSEVRDEANRAVLAEKKGAYQVQLNAIPPAPEKYRLTHKDNVRVEREEWKRWDEKYGDKKAHLIASLKGMEAIEQRFDDTGKEGLPEAYLLGFDAERNGRAIVANGNPDTADHTAVYVPGTTARLEAIDGDIGRMTNLWREASAMPGGPEVSTITWLGYDAPQTIVPEAMEKHWAHDGAPKLNRFLDGMQTVQGGADSSHTTVIGHSYGSTTVGAASEQGDLKADDIVVAGSPGMLVGEAGDLDVGKAHVWSEAASDDLVPAGGKAAGLGGYEWATETWNGIPYNAGYVQLVPSDEAFGAHRMAVDTSGHSDYWNADSTSLWNQAAVVTGNYDEVELG